MLQCIANYLFLQWTLTVYGHSQIYIHSIFWGVQYLGSGRCFFFLHLVVVTSVVVVVAKVVVVIAVVVVGLVGAFFSFRLSSVCQG